MLAGGVRKSLSEASALSVLYIPQIATIKDCGVQSSFHFYAEEGEICFREVKVVHYITYSQPLLKQR